MKTLITQDCFAPGIDGAVNLQANSVVELDVDTVRALVHAGRALYVDPKDDPSRVKQNTASESRVEAVRAAMKPAAKAAKVD